MINLKKLVSQILLSIIFILGSLIIINSFEKGRENYQKIVFSDNISFTKFINIYKKYVGNPIFIKEEGLSASVFLDDVSDYKAEKYLNGVKITYEKDEIVKSKTSGLVVFIGDKEDYGKTLIIQGTDGIDIWYGNITDIGVSLYDYVEENKPLGTTINNELFLVKQKDGNYLSFDDLINENKN